MFSHSQNRQPKSSNMPARCVLNDSTVARPRVVSQSPPFLTGTPNGCACGLQLLPGSAQRPRLEEGAPRRSDDGYSRLFHLHAGEVRQRSSFPRRPASVCSGPSRFRTLFWTASSHPPRASRGRGDHRFSLLQVANRQVDQVGCRSSAHLRQKNAMLSF